MNNSIIYSLALFLFNIIEMEQGVEIKTPTPTRRTLLRRSSSTKPEWWIYTLFVSLIFHLILSQTHSLVVLVVILLTHSLVVSLIFYLFLLTNTFSRRPHRHPPHTLSLCLVIFSPRPPHSGLVFSCTFSLSTRSRYIF